MPTTLADGEAVLRTSDLGECREAHLVLRSVGIAADVQNHDGWWLLIVGRSDLAAATAELEAYRRENPDPPVRHTTRAAVYGGAAAGVAVYAVTIVLVALLTAEWAFGLQWFSAGQMQAGKVMAGQWWRVVTALTLHLDAAHLIANLLFGAVFGLLAGRILGGGIAWLTIVAAGALGNLLNAAVQSSSHTSIGASTAVFAALGVIVSHALSSWQGVPEKPLKRWSPLIGGLLLLAFTGVGDQRTDFMAHFTGFFAGLLMGAVGCRLPHAWLANRPTQIGAGLAAFALVTAAWMVGLTVAG